MQYGDRVRVKKFPDIEFRISRQQFDLYGRETSVKSTTGRTMPITVWYSQNELEVIE